MFRLQVPLGEIAMVTWPKPCPSCGDSMYRQCGTSTEGHGRHCEVEPYWGMGLGGRQEACMLAGYVQVIRYDKTIIIDKSC